VEARDKLLILVDEDPQNEMAWVWLTGLVDRLDDKIIACENALTINPANDKVRAYLAQLLFQQNELAAMETGINVSQDSGNNHASASQTSPALPKSHRDEPWRAAPGSVGTMFSVNELAEKQAVMKAESGPRGLEINLLEVARQEEQDGKLVDALDTYRNLAATTKEPREFDRIYKEIIRLEGLQKERIQYVAPSASIVRMAFGWPLLYLSLVFVQAGGKFFAYPAWYLWLGVPFVAFGSFLIALSEVKARHPIWKSLFDEENSAGSAFARFAAGAMGWLLVIFPHLLLVVDSVVRLQHFQIPEMPF
jgi:hypothetical protein